MKDAKPIVIAVLLAVATCVGTAFAILSRYVSNDTFAVYQEGKRVENDTLRGDIQEIKSDIKDIKRDLNALVLRERNN